MKRRRDEPYEEDKPLSTDLAEKENEQLELYKTTIRDVRYILNQYRKPYPEEAWATIEKLVYNIKLK